MDLQSLGHDFVDGLGMSLLLARLDIGRGCQLISSLDCWRQARIVYDADALTDQCRGPSRATFGTRASPSTSGCGGAASRCGPGF
jgi:hypothetical protein